MLQRGCWKEGCKERYKEGYKKVAGLILEVKSKRRSLKKMKLILPQIPKTCTTNLSKVIYANLLNYKMLTSGHNYKALQEGA